MQKGRDRGRSASVSLQKPGRIDQIERLSVLQPLRLSHSLTADLAESILLLRRSRASIFGRHLFSDPGWDLLLQLYVAESDRRNWSLSELIEAMAMPASVVKRWITALVDAGIVASNSNPGTADCQSISLTRDAAAKMDRLIAQWASALPTR